MILNPKDRQYEETFEILGRLNLNVEFTRTVSLLLRRVEDMYKA